MQRKCFAIYFLLIILIRMLGQKYVEQTIVSIDYLNGVANQVITIFNDENTLSAILQNLLYI